MTSAAPPILSGEKARELVDTFAKGWAKGQIDQIISVFNTDAVFLETPFADALSGTDAIRKYWSDVPYHQSEISVSTGEIFQVGPWFSTEFKSVFRRRRTGDWVEARGALFCRDRWKPDFRDADVLASETVTSRIREFRGPSVLKRGHSRNGPEREKSLS